MAARRREGYNDEQLTFDLWGEPERERDEQVRQARDEPLAEDRADRYAAIPDKEGFLAELGERAGTEIQQLQDSLAGQDRPDESYLEKVGRLNMARLAAEERVLRELVLIPEPANSEEEQDGPAGTVQFMRDLAQTMSEIDQDEPQS